MADYTIFMPVYQTKRTSFLKFLAAGTLTSHTEYGIVKNMKLSVNGTTLFYERVGTGAPLILLHGNGESHGIFSALIPPLSEQFTVYAVDTRGHGKSAPVSAFHYADMAEDIAQLIAALSLEQPAVYGFSDGGITALLLALRSPELLSRIAVSGANLCPHGLTAAFLRSARREYRETKSPLLRLMLEEPRIAPRELASVRIPVLVTAGERDLVRERHTRAIARALPRSALKILKGETHESYVVHSAKLAPFLIPFFSGEDCRC